MDGPLCVPLYIGKNLPEQPDLLLNTFLNTDWDDNKKRTLMKSKNRMKKINKIKQIQD